MESANFLFCKADFFDRFKIGHSILFLRFLKETRERTEPILDSAKAKRTCLVEREIVGIYQGGDQNMIHLCPVAGRIEKIPSVSIRVLEEMNHEKLDAILEALEEISQDVKGHRALTMKIGPFNALRSMIDQNPILIPHAPME